MQGLIKEMKSHKIYMKTFALSKISHSNYNSKTKTSLACK